MSTKQPAQDTQPQIIVDTSGITRQLEEMKIQLREMKENQNPIAKPAALNEAVANGKEDYKVKLIEAIKGHKYIEWNEGITNPKVMSEAIGALTGANAIPDVWSSEVERLHVYPNSVFLSVPGLVNWKTDIVGRPGSTVEVPTVEKVVAVAVTDGTEPTATAATVSKVQIALSVIGASYYMTKSDIEDMVPSTIDALNAGLGSAIAEKLDTNFLTYLSAPASGTNTRGTLTTAALSSISMTGSLLARAVGSLRAGTYNPAFYICHPQTLISMMQTQAFYDASQFGTREVAERGAVANYFGVDIITTPCAYSTGGTYKSLLIAKGALCGVIKRKPEIESQYVIESGRTYIRADLRWGGTIVHGDGVFEINTKD